MLKIEMPLARLQRDLNDAASKQAPVACVEVDYQWSQPAVAVSLKGVIWGERAESLSRFLEAVASLHGNQWILRMDELDVVSRRGIEVLVEFSARIRQRGFVLKVLGIHESVFITLQEMNVLHAFDWAGEMPRLQHWIHCVSGEQPTGKRYGGCADWEDALPEPFLGEEEPDYYSGFVTGIPVDSRGDSAPATSHSLSS